MSANPNHQRARHIFGLLQPRCKRLGLGSWLIDESGQILAAHLPPCIRPSLATELEAAVRHLAPGNALAERIPLPDQRWLIPLPLGRRNAGMVVLATLSPLGESAAKDLACILQWMLADLSKSVMDDQTLGQFSEKLTQAYEETSLLFRLANMLNCGAEPNAMLQTICGELRQVLPFSWLAMRFTPACSEVPQLQDHLLVAGQLPIETDAFVIAADALLAGRASEDWVRVLPAQDSDLGKLTGSDVLAEPITHDDRIIGAIFGGGKSGDDPDFTSGEMLFLKSAAEFLGMFHENLARFAEQRAMFMGTLKALTASIDAKDAYTCGHSERVALLSRQLALALGMNTHDAEKYYVAGLVHDVGKIGVPEEVLCKEGRLDDSEFAWIKRHPEMGHRILKDIPSLDAALLGVLHHHEHWDGKGYPARLAGEAIPRIARVVALADAFDAMSSTRSYRPAMERSIVLAEITRCSGTHFDPAMVPLFLNLDWTEFDAMLAKSQATAPFANAYNKGIDRAA